MKKRLGRILAAVGIMAVLCIVLTACMGPIGRNQDPMASFTTTQESGTFKVTFDGSSSFDSDGDVVLWNWDFGDGEDGSEVTVVHIYERPGTYSVRLRVRDDDGARDEVTKVVTVTPDPSPPVACFYIRPRGDVQTGSLVTFHGGGSYDPDGSIEWAWWDFGDGSAIVDGSWTEMEQDPFGVWKEVPGMSKITYIYYLPGDYTVTLMIMDNDGKTGSRSRTITVR